MPCSEWSQEGGSVEYRDRPSTKAKLDKVTKLLCSTLKRLKKNNFKTYQSVIGENYELAQWWTKHQEQDIIRKLVQKTKTKKK